jgi:23S rRNA pseudouridine2605 synthase
MTNNEKWQGKSNSNAGRDGKPYEKRDVKSILKGSKGAPKYNNERPGQDNEPNNDRPVYKRRDDNSPQPERRNYDNRPNNYGDRRQGDTNQGGRPRFVVRKNNDGGNNSGERNYGDRNNSERNYGGDRNNAGGERRYNNYDNRNQNGDRPFKRPRIQSQDGENRFQRPVQPGGRSDSGYIETRFDNRKDGVSFRKPKRKTGNYDPNSKYSQKKQYEYKSAQIDPTKPVRLNKFLANAGICSRREADEFIQAGVISVNGAIVSELGVKILPTDRVMFHNQLVRSERKVYILLNKPKDCVTTSEDTHDRLTVLDLVKNACSERIYPVGRLDRNTTGVILLTNDGDLASKLTHPKFEKKKIYHVSLDKTIETADFETILSGVILDDEKIAADSLEFVKEGDFKQLGIEIHSGQNRVVRRIFEKLGYKVVRLDRVYFAGLTKKNLPRGKYRFLSEREVNMLKMGAYE